MAVCDPSVPPTLDYMAGEEAYAIFLCMKLYADAHTSTSPFNDKPDRSDKQTVFAPVVVCPCDRSKKRQSKTRDAFLTQPAIIVS